MHAQARYTPDMDLTPTMEHFEKYLFSVIFHFPCASYDCHILP